MQPDRKLQIKTTQQNCDLNQIVLALTLHRIPTLFQLKIRLKQGDIYVKYFGRGFFFFREICSSLSISNGPNIRIYICIMVSTTCQCLFVF